MNIKLSYVPRPHQRAAHNALKRFSVLVWHRRAGKTIFAVMELLLGAMKCKKSAARFAYVAPFYGQAKSVCWEILKKFAREIPDAVIKEGELTVMLNNGNTVRLFGADNPDTLRGLYFDGIVLDEVADMKAPIWGEIVRPALTDRQGWAIFIGTPKGLNLFSELYNHALKDPEWFADLKRVSDTQAIPAAEVEQARKEMAPPTFAQEFECDFAAAAVNAFIPLDLVIAACNRTLVRNDYHYAPRVMGVDVARHGDDRSVLFMRQGHQAFKPYIFRNLDTQQLADQVVHYMLAEKIDMVFIDDNGVGGGVTDRIRALGFSNLIPVISGAKAVNPKYSNMRAQMWDYLRLWLKEGGCLPQEQGLENDLCAPMYWFSAGDKLCIESGPDMKSRGLPSPDLAAGLYLTFAYPVQKLSDQGQHSRNSGKCISDYDVLA